MQLFDTQYKGSIQNQLGWTNCFTIDYLKVLSFSEDNKKEKR